MNQDGEMCVYNVLDSGAKADGSSSATIGIQQTIDKAAANGGGMVYFPPGKYISGSLRLQSNISLYFEAGAILYGSEDFADYEQIKGRCYLISGFDCENVSIRGRGAIHGQGLSFWDTEKPFKKTYKPYQIYGKKALRPFAMIHFRESKNISIEDVTLIDSACYAVWLLGCDGAQIRGIELRNSHHGPNTDGLDIDCSSNVSVSDCNLDAGDDCIALKSDTNALGRMKACENITVTNCQLSSSTNAIRVGYEGDGPIRNCVFSNLVFHDCASGIAINVISGVERDGIKIVNGPKIENIIFSGIVMDVEKALHMWTGKSAPSELEGYIKNIKFENIIARITRGSYIGGCQEAPISGVEFSNVKLVIRGEKGEEFLEEVPHPMSVWGEYSTPGLPYGFYCRYVEEMSFSDVSIEWENAGMNWSSVIRCEDISGLSITGLVARQSADDSEYSVINLSGHISGCFISGCRALKGSGTFLLLRGKKVESVAFCFNDMREAAKAVECDEEVSRDAVTEHSNVP